MVAITFRTILCKLGFHFWEDFLEAEWPMDGHPPVIDASKCYIFTKESVMQLWNKRCKYCKQFMHPALWTSDTDYYD